MAFGLQLVRHNKNAIVVGRDHVAIAVSANDGASFLDQFHPRIVVRPSEDIALDGMWSGNFNVLLASKVGSI